MKLVRIDNAKSGDVLGKSILDDKNRTLLNAGTTLSENIIKKIADKGYKALWIDDQYSITQENKPEVQFSELISDKVKMSTLKSLKDFNIQGILDSAKTIIEELFGTTEIIFDEVQNERDLANEIYEKALQVCIYCVGVAKKLGTMTLNEINDLAVAALLHDVGKLCKNQRNMDKIEMSKKLQQICHIEGDYKEYQDKLHPAYAFALLSGNPEISATAKMSILTHHENMDGSGYPCHWNGDQLFLASKIIRVCDAYDSLVMDEKMNPEEALNYLDFGKGKIFDPMIVETFKSAVAIYPKGIEVKLSDGRVGIVYQNHSGLPNRPTVLLKDGTLLHLESVTENLNITILGEYDEEKEQHKSIK